MKRRMIPERGKDFTFLRITQPVDVRSLVACENDTFTATVLDFVDGAKSKRVYVGIKDQYRNNSALQCRWIDFEPVTS